LMAGLDGFSLYAVDRPCFGLTGHAEHRAATLRKLAADFLEQVLDALELERPLFVANSIGSLWTISLALERPDRVTAMVHVGCPAFILGTSAPLPLRVLSLPLFGRALMALSPPSPRQVEAFASQVAREDLSQLPELVDLLVAAQKMPGAQASVRRLLRAVLRLRGARPEVALPAEQLARISQPVLLVWGSEDRFGGLNVAEEAARIIPVAELRVLHGAGHVPWLGQPAKVAAATRTFLRKAAVTTTDERATA
jgi:pimeloyl-ACP methyl ester carboxylesterase